MTKNSMTSEELILKRLDSIESMLKSQKEVLTVKECAIYLDVSEDRVRHLLHDAELPFYKSGRKTLISRKDVELWQTRERFPSKYETLERATTYIATQRKTR
ncbi:MAG: helix-turn-helix domain-containing protein [Prevotella sp.]|nr:helix-turn-helix domain-containing protein [Prevotella sp.]